MAKSSGNKLTKFTNGTTIVTADTANKLYGGLYGSTEGDAYNSDDPIVAGHIHDGGHADGHAQKVNVGSHVTGKLKNTNLADDAVNIRNIQGFTTQSQAIPEFETIGLDTFYYLDLSDLRAEIGLLSTEDASFLATNEYYVDDTATDNADLRIYSTLALAIDAAEAEQIDGYIIRLREGQTHIWDSPSFSGNQDITVISASNRNGNLNILAGTLPLGTGVKITFCNLNISHAGNLVDSGVNILSIESCDVDSTTGLSFSSFLELSTRNVKFIGTKFDSVGADGMFAEDCSWQPGSSFPAGSTVFDFGATSVSYFKKCDFDVSSISNWTLFQRSAGDPLIRLHGCDISAGNTGMGTSRIFGTSSSLVLEAKNVQITNNGGTVNFGSATMYAGYMGLSWHGDRPTALDHPEETWFMPVDVSFLAPNEYYVDDTAVVNTEQRIYLTVATAVAAAEAEQSNRYIIRIREGQAHTWDGTGFSGDLDITITGSGQSAGLILNAAGFTSATGASIRFDNITIVQAGNTVDTGANIAVSFDKCYVLSLGGLFWLGFGRVIATGGTTFIGTRFTSIGAFGGSFSNMHWTPGGGFPSGVSIFSFAESVTSEFINCSFNADGIDDWTLFRRTSNSPTVDITNCSINAENTGGGASWIFGTSSSLNVRLLNVSITRYGTGVVNFGSATLATTITESLSWHGPLPDDNILPFQAWRSAPVSTAFSTVIASDVSQVLKTFNLTDFLIEGNSFKLRWYVTFPNTVGATTARINVIIDDSGLPNTIVLTGAVDVANGYVQNGEINFDVSDVTAGIAQIHATGYFTDPAAPLNTGVALLGVNVEDLSLNVASAIIKIETTFSAADASSAVLRTCRLEGTPVTQTTI